MIIFIRFLLPISRHAAGVVPTVTGCGITALMPGADGRLRLVERDGSLVPAIGTRLLKTSADRMKLLAETYGDRFFETTLDELLGSPKKVAANLKSACPSVSACSRMAMATFTAASACMRRWFRWLYSGPEGPNRAPPANWRSISAIYPTGSSAVSSS